MDTVWFGILGPLLIHRGGRSCQVGRQKSRQLLATLLLHPNRFVSTDLICDVLWGDTPPRSAAANIRSYVHVLRASLHADGADPLIETYGGGYSINVPVEGLDSTQLQRLNQDAERLRADGDDAAALRATQQAYRLWRGTVLDDLPVAPAWQVTISALEHARWQVLDNLVDLLMRLGHYHTASPLLRTWIDEDPYSETLWYRYLSCLAATGRTDEARRGLRQIQRALIEEAGTPPGELLTRLADELSNGGGFQVAAVPPNGHTNGHRGHTSGHAGRPTVSAPSQLPLDVDDFTGRDAELAELADLLGAHEPRRPPVVVVSGLPGAGKTAFAVRLGHLLRDRFPDGQLFLDMRGTSAPREPGSGLLELLRSLGVSDVAIPTDTDRRAAMLRSELAGRRVLVVLDDATAASQVAPLLPGTGRAAVLVTSRKRLTDLPGVVHRTLGELADEDGAALLCRVAGDGQRIDPEAARRILRACGNLPLAIRIAGSRLAQRPDLSPADLVMRLTDERRRLDELRVGDLAVRPSADLSYRMLREPEARMYRVLGLLGACDLPAWLLNESGVGPDPQHHVGALLEANLVRVTGDVPASGYRYRIHDLLRCHALELAETEAPEQARDDVRAVLGRLLARSAHMAQALPARFFGTTLDADEVTVPGLHPGVAVPTGPHPGVDAAPVEWFDSHRQAFLALTAAAVEYGGDDLAWQLAVTWSPYHDLRAYYDDWVQSHTLALPAARRTGSVRGEAILLRNLGQLAIYRDEYQPAEAALRESYRLFAKLDDEAGSAVAALSLGTYHRETGATDQALHWYHVGMRHFLTAADPYGEAVARNAIAGIWLDRQEPFQAAPWLDSALELAVRTGDSHREAQVRRRIAVLREQQSDPEQAVRELRTALDILMALGDDHCASYVQRSLGELLANRGEVDAARRMLIFALNVGHRLGDRRAEALSAARLGRLHRDMGNAAAARQYFRRAERAWPRQRDARNRPVPAG